MQQLQTNTGDTVDRHNFTVFLDPHGDIKVKGEPCKTSPPRGRFRLGGGGWGEGGLRTISQFFYKNYKADSF